MEAVAQGAPLMGTAGEWLVESEAQVTGQAAGQTRAAPDLSRVPELHFLTTTLQAARYSARHQEIMAAADTV